MVVYIEQTKQIDMTKTEKIAILMRGLFPNSVEIKDTGDPIEDYIYLTDQLSVRVGKNFFRSIFYDSKSGDFKMDRFFSVRELFYNLKKYA